MLGGNQRKTCEVQEEHASSVHTEVGSGIRTYNRRGVRGHKRSDFYREMLSGNQLLVLQALLMSLLKQTNKEVSHADLCWFTMVITDLVLV